MAKEQIAAEQEALGEAMNKTELFFERNGRNLIYVLLGLLVLGGAIFGYRALVSQPRIERAAELMAEAQNRFDAENPDFELALNGDANGAGFLEVIDRYGATPSGNLAKHYAGICYLRTGDLENAAKYLAKYNPVKGIPGALVNAQNLGLRGDVAVEQQEYAKAVSLYERAVKAADNNMTAPLYLYKAGLAAKAQGDAAKAKALFERIASEYPASMEARDAEKHLGTIE